MIRGLYTAASGLMAGERMQEVLTDNLANVGTAGFKGSDGLMRSFPEELLYQLNDHGRAGPESIGYKPQVAGRIGTGALLEEILPRLTQGSLKSTDNPYGFAIIDVDRTGLPVGSADAYRATFFPMNDGAGGTVLGRSGDFHVDRDGYLRSQGNQFVQAIDAQGQAIAGSRVHQADNGTIEAGRVDPATGTFTVDAGLRLGTVDVLDTRQLRDLGNGLYRTDAANLGLGTGEMRKGFIEMSNVDPTTTMVNMMDVMRLYEANQRVIQTLDRSLDKAVNEIGRV